MTLRDYEAWLARYDDPGSSLSWRLAIVQRWLGEELDRRSGALRVVSLCAGDGRDVIDVLAARGDAERVGTTLVEIHPGMAERARTRAIRAGVDVRVRVADAADTASLSGAVPADIVLLVGILGNISDEDVLRTVAASPGLCSPGASLIWSRGRDRSDINARVRAAFAASGFREHGYERSDLPGLPALGLVRYGGPPTALIEERRLFTFFR